ncbi:cryptochrome/photolyase family protein [Candidatus Dependentiae bacterium Noda2021]|nr:cryptochrome/photolyase family protein [Candidatus Dependentiae bacterium Noda2021]
MKTLAHDWAQAGHNVVYLEYGQALFDYLKKKNIKELSVLELIDHDLQKTLGAAAKKAGIHIDVYQSPAFLCDQERIDSLLGDKESFRMSGFYAQQRKDFNILMTAGKPTGGKWSFDTENRKKLPKDLYIPSLQIPRSNAFVAEAHDYVAKHFPDNPGEAEGFIYPTSHNQSEQWLEDFLEHRLVRFGDYQDAFEKNQVFTFHSVLTPMLNSGLLTPAYVVGRTLEYAKHHKNISLNNLEGFIRQIIGWREFVRGVYSCKGIEQKDSNFFSFKRKLPDSFYTGTTGIDPVDDAIKKINKFAYVHHIERLMVLGNFMFLCEINPKEVYRWFMELFIDAYDWVMVPNVFGMSQYADGGLMTTKPYFSSSNYIKNMSNYKKGPWADVWDALFWRFIYKHQELIGNTARLAIMNSYLKRLKPERLKELLRVGDAFLKQL